jgi:hypothetical protein
VAQGQTDLGIVAGKKLPKMAANSKGKKSKKA